MQSARRFGRTSPRRAGRQAHRDAEAARGLAELAAAARALAAAEDRLDAADKRLADRDALQYAVEVREAAARDGEQLRQQADEEARTLRLDAERDAAEMRAAAQREASELRAAAAAEVERLRQEVVRETRKMRVQAKALAEARRTGAHMHLQVEEHAARVRAEANELMRRATAAARAQSATGRTGAPSPAPSVATPARKPPARSTVDARRRTRRARIGVLMASLLAVGGVGLTAAAGPQDIRDSAVGLAQASGWSPQKLDVAALQQRLGPAPERRGPSGRALAGALRQLEQLADADRRNRALGLANDVETAVRNGLLDPEAERLVRPVLLREITPPDIQGLIDLLEVRALGAGPGGEQILTALRALPARPSGAERAAVLQQVRDLGDAGQLTTAFRYAADQVLS